jgi:hypothetical protein
LAIVYLFRKARGLSIELRIQNVAIASAASQMTTEQPRAFHQ